MDNQYAPKVVDILLERLMKKLNVKSPMLMKGLLFGAAVALAALAAVYIAHQAGASTVSINRQAQAEDGLVAEVGTYTYSQAPEEAAPEVIMVYVSGEVRSAGVFQFYYGARVVDAIEAAGGFTEYADPNAINLAARLVDAQHIVVFSLEDNMPHTATAVPGQPGHPGDDRININTATSDELQALSGIGPALSERIVNHREARGGFETIEEIMNVSGIGERIFDSIRDRIRVE